MTVVVFGLLTVVGPLAIVAFGLLTVVGPLTVVVLGLLTVVAPLAVVVLEVVTVVVVRPLAAVGVIRPFPIVAVGPLGVTVVGPLDVVVGEPLSIVELFVVYVDVDFAISSVTAMLVMGVVIMLSWVNLSTVDDSFPSIGLSVLVISVVSVEFVKFV